MNKEIYEVDRNYYKDFLSQIKSCARDVTVEEDDEKMTTSVYSIKTNKILCARESYKADNISEKYYIYNLPDQDEMQPLIPKRQLVLKTREEVQAFFDALSRYNKEHENK